MLEILALFKTRDYLYIKDKVMTEYQIYKELKKLGIINYTTFQDYILDKIKKVDVKKFYKQNDEGQQKYSRDDR